MSHQRTLTILLLGIFLSGCASTFMTNTSQPDPTSISIVTAAPLTSAIFTPTQSPILPTPIVFPDASFSTVETIYDDQLGLSWNSYPPDGDPTNIQFDQSTIAVSGNAIRGKLLPTWALDFSTNLTDWERFQWLEFDLYIDPESLPEIYTIGVCLRDDEYTPSKKVQLLQSPFIEDENIKPGTWQHIQIPLAMFGSVLSQYDTISIRRLGSDANSPMIIYVDNVILRDKSPVASLDDQKSNIYDDFNDPNYAGGLNHDLWIRVEDPSSSTQVFQQDGILVLSDSGDTVGQGALLEFGKWQKPIFSFFEARIKVHYENGSNGNLALAGVSEALKGGWTEMSLTPDADGATMRVLGFAQARVENDTWYVLRIEYDDEKNVLSFFLDGKLVTSYEAPNKVESLVPEINLWHPERGSGVGYIDYIAIGN